MGFGWGGGKSAAEIRKGLLREPACRGGGALLQGERSVDESEFWGTPLWIGSCGGRFEELACSGPDRPR